MIKIILRNKKLANGEYPIVLRIIKDNKTKIISLGINCPKEHWNGYELNKKHSNFSVKNRVLLKKKEKALKIIDDFILEELDFTLNQFEQKFRGKSYNKIDVYEFWQEKIDDLNRAGRTGNARAFKDTYNSFRKFTKNKKIVFKEITSLLLDKYETHLRETGSQDGGIAFRMRMLRALFNDAIKKGAVASKYYPFKDYKISKLKGKSIKRALIRDEVRLIESFDTSLYPHLIDTKNYFNFSYYARGMNFVDMMKLKWDNIQGDRIQYIRSKTKGKFTVKMLEPVEKIIEYYKAQNRPTDYVFPILLKDGLTPIQISNRHHKTLSKFNKQLKEIAKIQGINQNVTSYVIRHSFATNLKFAGISTDLICESMGHNNVSVTQAYLKEFKDDAIDEAMNKLLEEPILKYV